MRLPAHVGAFFLLAASMGCLAPSQATHAAGADTGSTTLAWDCEQSQDAAFHVVCKPSCSVATVRAASMQPSHDSGHAAEQPVWGQPAVFRSARKAAAISPLAEAEIAADCTPGNQVIDHAVSARRPAPHLVPIAERKASEIFTGKPWKVPLYSRPTDPTVVTRLLREVLCGSAACVVQYSLGQSPSVARY